MSLPTTNAVPSVKRIISEKDDCPRALQGQFCIIYLIIFVQSDPRSEAERIEAERRALNDIVVEYEPIFRRFRGMLDGPQERSWLVDFEIFLMCRIAHKPDLEKILGSSE